MSESGTFTTIANKPALTRAEEMKREKARQSLIGHRDFPRVFGENYYADPRFEDALAAVLDGREPRLVLQEYPSKPKDEVTLIKPTDGTLGGFG